MDVLQILLKETKTMNHETMRIVIVGDIFEGKVKASNEAKAEFHTLEIIRRFSAKR